MRPRTRSYGCRASQGGRVMWALLDVLQFIVLVGILARWLKGQKR